MTKMYYVDFSRTPIRVSGPQAQIMLAIGIYFAKMISYGGAKV